LGCLGLGAVQGGIGWWMVKSGLTEEDNTVKAKVSPYRLATHLVTAFALLTLLTVLKQRAASGRVTAYLGNKPLPAPTFMRSCVPTSLAHALAMMTFITAASGAMVAGNEAGLVYNEFPLMGGQVIPDDLISPYVTPVWKNFLENPVAVQWVHRCLAISTWTLAFATAGRCFFATTLPPIRKAANRVFGLATLQATLGISTLLMGVPIELAAAHQAGAMLVLMAATRLLFLSKNPALAMDHRVADQLQFASRRASAEFQAIRDQKANEEAMAQADAQAKSLGYESYAQMMEVEYKKAMEEQKAKMEASTVDVTDAASSNGEKTKTDVKQATSAVLIAMGLLQDDEEEEEVDSEDI
jgi:heme A synthase